MGGCQGSELAGHLLYGTLLGHLSPSLSPQGPDRPSCSPLGPAHWPSETALIRAGSAADQSLPSTWHGFLAVENKHTLQLSVCVYVA